MGLGVLDDKKLDPVPGTETLNDTRSAASIDESNHHLKRSKDGIILVPQPSDDPNDPLNWPLWRRDLITFLLSMAALLSATLTSLMAANSLQFFGWFKHVTITEIAMLTGWHMLGIGIAGYVFVASARIWGKRHLYILGMLIVIVSSVWAGCSGHNYKSLVAARFFQGVGLAPFEALLNASVGELYFVHESGARMALSNMSLFGAAFLAPVLVGNISANPHLGWEWTFWFVAIFVGAVFPLVFLFCPETAYVRKHAAKPAEPATPPTASPSSYQQKEGTSSVEKIDSPTISFSSELGDFSGTYPPTYGTHPQRAAPILSWHSMRLFTGRKTDESFVKVFIRPFPLFLHPSILWSCLIQGSIIGWTTLLGVMLASLVAVLGFNEVQTGNMYAGAFIGAMLGFVACFGLADPVAKLMTKLNKGVYEPEFRLILVIPLFLFSVAGLYGFGNTTDGHHGWFLPDLFFAFVCGGLVFGTVAPALYVVDAHRDLSVEAFTCMLLFKNIISWMLCYKGFGWLAVAGPQHLFTIIASVEIGICALTIPLYVFGKKSRSFFARYDYIQMLGLR